MGANMQVSGMKELIAQLQTLGTKAARVENDALRAGGSIVAEAMRQGVNRSDRNSVHIQDDIKVSNVKQREGVKLVEVGPGKETNWRAKFLEFGTTKMSPRPFIEPAAVETSSDVIKTMTDTIRGGLGL